MDSYFSNKKAIVTGAGSGIGRAVTLKLVQMGCHVIAVSKDMTKLNSLIHEAGRDGLNIKPVSVNLSSWADTDQMLGPLSRDIDFLINNAGYAANALIEEISEQQVRDMLDVNLTAPINLTRLVVPGMKARKFGCIVNVSSVASIAALDTQAVYSATKAGLDMLTKVAAKELGPFNIRVNSINPTVVWTELGRRVWGDPAKQAMLLQRIPMNRFVELDEVVEPILFLLRPGSGMVNGITLPIDGGYSAE